MYQPHSNRIRLMGFIALMVTFPLVSAGQTPAAKKKAVDVKPPVPATAPAPQVVAAPSLSIEDIIKMVEAKVPESIVASKVRKNQTAFDLTPDQLIALKKAAASDNLIEVLMDPSKAYVSPPVPPVPTVVPVAPAPPPPPVVAEKPPLEIGVYVKKAGEWAEVQPEVVNWKTGGAIKSLASAGVVKKDLNGNIDGPSSKNSVKSPVEVLIVTAEGIAPSEYQLLRLRINKDYREFRSVTGGILNQRGGAMRDLVPFESKKVAPRNFIVILPASLGAGEYGVLPPGAGGSSTTNAVSSSYGKMFTFHIIE